MDEKKIMQTHIVNPKYMCEAIVEARKARGNGDYAIGAVIVYDGNIIGRGQNNIINSDDPTGHAEIRAIRMACNSVMSRHIEGAVLYTTHKPCPMCIGAAIMAKLTGIVYGARRETMEKYGRDLADSDRSWRVNRVTCHEIARGGMPPVFVFLGLLEKECNELFHSD